MIQNLPTIQSSWGRNLKARGYSTSRIEEICCLPTERAVRGAIPSGLGRSYGDSSLNSGGLRIDSSAYKELLINEITGIAECGSGISIRELEYQSHLRGFLPPVVPGTGFVTLGGAFASDIHGKSQQYDGNFSDHVTSISVIDAQGIEKEYMHDSEEFRATAGGMGLTGFISRLRIKLRKVDVPMIYQKEVRVRNLNEMMSTLESLEGNYPYTVAWIDLSGSYIGRGVVSAGRLALKTEVDSKQTQKFGFKLSSRTLSIPLVGYFNLMKTPVIRCFNELWFRKPLRNGVTSFPKFMHPLDSIGNWNQIYGKSGFVQYQLVIPQENSDALFEILDLLKLLKMRSFLTVLKKFGPNRSGFLSFPMQGWTLAMDFASDSKNLTEAIRILDALVIRSGGRIYLTKDSTSSPKSIELMYGDLDKWRSVKRRMDPSNFWQSDQSRRLNLC